MAYKPDEYNSNEFKSNLSHENVSDGPRSAAQLSRLNRVRAGHRASATRALNNLESDFPSMDIPDLEFHFDKLSNIKCMLSDLNEQVLNIILLSPDTKSDDIDEEFYKIEEYSDKLGRALKKIEHKIKQSNPLPIPSPTGGTESGFGLLSGSKPKLPDLDLPKFNGESKDFNKFINSFKSIICNYNLTSQEKFNYLEKCCTGNARWLIARLEKIFF